MRSRPVDNRSASTIRAENADSYPQPVDNPVDGTEPGRADTKVAPDLTTRRAKRPPMEIGNVWRSALHPNRIHYMLYWTDAARPQEAHLVELEGSALAKILVTRIR